MSVESVPVLTGDLVMETIFSITHSPMLYLLLGLIAMDFVTGSAKAFKTGQFSSKVGINGLIMHLLVLILVIFLKFFGRLFGLHVAIYGMSIAFSVNYFTSIVENVEAMGFVFPEGLKKGLKQTQDNSNEIIIGDDDQVVVRKNTGKKGKDR